MFCRMAMNVQSAVLRNVFRSKGKRFISNISSVVDMFIVVISILKEAHILKQQLKNWLCGHT